MEADRKEPLAASAGSALIDARLGVPDHLAGVIAEDETAAEGILEFACPTKGADGKWYRCTLATSNVPVAELYNVLSGIAFVAARLREIGGPALMHQANELDRMRDLLKARDGRPDRAAAARGQNLHAQSPNARAERCGRSIASESATDAGRPHSLQ